MRLFERILADKPHPQDGIPRLTQQARNSHAMVEFTLKQQVKDSEGRLKEDLRRLQERVGEIVKRL